MGFKGFYHPVDRTGDGGACYLIGCMGGADDKIANVVSSLIPIIPTIARESNKCNLVIDLFPICVALY